MACGPVAQWQRWGEGRLGRNLGTLSPQNTAAKQGASAAIPKTGVRHSKKGPCLLIWTDPDGP
jgi:hypothetical protein